MDEKPWSIPFRIWSGLLLFAFPIGAVIGLLGGHFGQSRGPLSIIGPAIMLVDFILVILTLVGVVLLDTNRSLNEAQRPIPSPPQIANALRYEWGREPTVEEVYAVQQMLHNRRNEALLNAGIGLGALYLGAHEARKL